jgi:hypothetical protein
VLTSVTETHTVVENNLYHWVQRWISHLVVHCHVCETAPDARYCSLLYLVPCPELSFSNSGGGRVCLVYVSLWHIPQEKFVALKFRSKVGQCIRMDPGNMSETSTYNSNSSSPTKCFWSLPLTCDLMHIIKKHNTASCSILKEKDVREDIWWLMKGFWFIMFMTCLIVPATGHDMPHCTCCWTWYASLYLLLDMICLIVPATGHDVMMTLKKSVTNIKTARLEKFLQFWRCLNQREFTWQNCYTVYMYITMCIAALEILLWLGWYLLSLLPKCMKSSDKIVLLAVFNEGKIDIFLWLHFNA